MLIKKIDSIINPSVIQPIYSQLLPQACNIIRNVVLGTQRYVTDTKVGRVIFLTASKFLAIFSDLLELKLCIL